MLACEDGVQEKRRVNGEVHGADGRGEIRAVQECDWGESLGNTDERRGSVLTAVC